MSDRISTRCSRKPTSSPGTILLEGSLHACRRENPQATAALRQRAADTLHRLEQFPESGRSIPEFPDLPYHEVIVRPCRFFYRIKGSTVWIVAAWHGAQLPKNP